jgi:tRNA A37 N6-isopentenylltransferase MiaA
MAAAAERKTGGPQQGEDGTQQHLPSPGSCTGPVLHALNIPSSLARAAAAIAARAGRHPPQRFGSARASPAVSRIRAAEVYAATCRPPENLEKQKLVERRPHPTDRRARQLVLTAEGSTLRGRLLELLEQESPLAGLSAQEQDALHDLLQRTHTRR